MQKALLFFTLNILHKTKNAGGLLFYAAGISSERILKLLQSTYMRMNAVYEIFCSFVLRLLTAASTEDR